MSEWRAGGRARWWLRSAVAALLVFTAGGIVGFDEQPSSAAGTTTFDPIPATRLGPQSVFGRVVTDGSGTFHSIAREEGVAQQIVYRRSVDGGQTWTIRGKFNGDAGGGSRPWIAVDGDRVAITFIGVWCQPGVSFCEDAPYLVTSTDAGSNWNRPLRMDNQAFNVRVAVDADRVWLASQRGTTVRLEGTADGGLTLFADTVYAGRGLSLDAADGMMVLAFLAPSAPGAGSVLGTVTAQGRVLGPLATRPLPSIELPSVATANGRAHVVLVDAPLDPIADPPSVRVTTAIGAGPFAAPIVVMPAGQSVSIDAVKGTVAIGVSDRGGATWVSTSADGGNKFSPAVAVSASQFGPLHDSEVNLALATPPQDRPIARFDWSVPERYTDNDGDGRATPANGSGNDTLDQLRVYANQAMTVKLDGCPKPADTQTITNYAWSIDGVPGESGPGACAITLSLDDGTTAAVRLVVEDDHGVTSSVEQIVAPRDLLVVSIGDSVASGEGSPHTGGESPVTWQDAACHRSAYSGPALAARQLELADRRSSVTFVQLSCSGAAIVDSPEIPGIDDPATGGLIDWYEGVAPTPGSLRPSQLEQMATLTGNRPVDALLVSIGANDVRFSDVVIACIIEFGCDRSPTSTQFQDRMDQLPARYRRLAQGISARGVPPHQVHLTEYFDPTSDSDGITQMRCAIPIKPFGVLDLLDDDEAIWARDAVIGQLNATGRAAAADAGWRYVGGIAQQFSGHGYCAGDHWVVQLGESRGEQGDVNGAFHPNRAGQRVYGAAIFAGLRNDLLIPAPVGTPGGSGGSTALGDLMVVTTNYDEIISASVNVTGGTPMPVGTRRLDRLALGDGLLFPAGPPAVDNSVAVATWSEFSGIGAFETQTLVAQIAVRPNAAVRSVRIVQAPADGTVIVHGRDTVVQATIDAAVPVSQPLAVTTTVIATDSSGVERQLVPPTVQQMSFDNGRNVVLLPTDMVFRAEEGERVSAVVEVTDPVGAAVGDEFDNVASSAGHDPEALTTRPLIVMVGRASIGTETVSCETAKSVAERMGSYASAAMPVDADGVATGLFCGLLSPVAPSEPGLLAALAELDEFARHAKSDAIVIVVPDGWLRAAAGGAIGAAISGMRGVILEASAPAETLAHELSHIYGLRHTDGLIPAFGARVDTRVNRAGSDWMAAIAQTKAWTGGRTWDRLAAVIGGPANAPVALDRAGPGVWVRGTVVKKANGSWAVTAGQWLPAGTGSATDPIESERLDLSRMSVDQVDAGGNVVESTPVGLGEGNGLYGTGVTPPADPIGLGFASLVTLDPAATSLQLILDGDLVETIAVSAPPSVTLTSPVAGAVIPRGAPLTVSWNESDPDSATITRDVFISGDDGATWRPFASDVAGTTLTAPVPQEVGGDAVRVRVIVSDGLHFGEAVSGSFSAEPSSTLGVERIVFVRDLDEARQYQPHLLTMKPDGSDVVPIDLPPLSVSNFGPAQYQQPSWGADGRLYFASDLKTHEFGGDPSVSDVGTRIWSAEPDGSDLQRLSSYWSDTSYWPTTPVGQSLANETDGCPALSPDGETLVWLGTTPGGGNNGITPAHIWIARRAGSGWSPPTPLVTGGPQPLMTLHPSYPTQTNEPQLSLSPPGNEFGQDSCPHWSADGQSLAFVGAFLVYDNAATPSTVFDHSPIVVVDIDDSSLRVVSPMPSYLLGGGRAHQTDFYESVDWSNGALVVSRGFENLATFDPNGGLGSSPKRWGVFTLDPATGTVTRRSPEPDLSVNDRPNRFKASPTGTLYGFQYHSFNALCNLGDSDMAIVDPGSGGTEDVPAEDGLCGDGDHGFDWAVVTTGPGIAPPQLVPDPAAAPDDGNAPVDVDVDVVSTPNPEPGAGADDFPPEPPPVAAPLVDLVVPADTPSTVLLSTIDGRPAAFEIVIPPPTSVMTMTGEGFGGVAVTTGLDGEIVVTPAPGFRGATTFSYAVLGHRDQAALVTITVVGNAPPVAVDDDLEVTAGVETLLPAATLLANDFDPDAPPSSALAQEAGAADPIRLVSVFGSDSGRAWLDTSGIVHVLATDAGSYTFEYAIADVDGAVSRAVAHVVASAPPIPPATDPTTTTTLATTPSPDVTVTDPTPSPPTTLGPPAVAPPTPNPVLPQTGADLRFGSMAAIVLVVGIVVTIGVRRRRFPSDGSG